MPDDAVSWAEEKQTKTRSDAGGTLHAPFDVPQDANMHCPYCHDALTGTVVSCTRCNTPFHEACLQELGSCATLGCANHGRRVST